MSGSVGYVVAFGGGVASFISPCVLPVVPAYLSMVTGLDITESGRGTRHHLGKVIRDTLGFVGGFALVFVLLGVSATAIGAGLVHHRLLLTRVSGAVILVMAAFLAGSLALRLPFLYREVRFHPAPSRLGPVAAPIAGVAFGFGWTPCIGPVLTSVLAVAGLERGIGQGAALLAVYAAGLGLPFLIVGCSFSRMAGALAFVRRHSGAITVASSLLLALFGVLLVINRFSWLSTELEAGLRAIGLGRLVTVG
ncbi:MAG: cytochrome c biosis protein transrane region [Acidimicrobiaceae bacterium]|nr:cytochrome c biosis protein transrane region [Acidimicrobiaceae bacterium]